MIKRIEARGSIEIAKRTLSRCGMVMKYGIAHGYRYDNPAGDLTYALKSKKVQNLASLPATEMPEFLTYYEYAVYVWERVKGVMENSRIYNEADAGKLARYCVLQAQFEESIIYSNCEKENEEIDTDEDGDNKHHFGASKLAQLRLLERDLYLDPEMRAKIGNKKKKASNPFAELMKK